MAIKRKLARKPRFKRISVPKAKGAKPKRVPIEEKALAEIAAALGPGPLDGEVLPNEGIREGVRKLAEQFNSSFADAPLTADEPEPVNVAESLARSAAEMLRFHQIDRTRRAGRQVDMKACAVEARRLRVEADEADPEHTDPAWANDKVPSSEIVAFFDRYIQGH